MSNISPDGAWRWDGRQWVPNKPPPSADGGHRVFQPTAGWGADQGEHAHGPQHGYQDSWSSHFPQGQWYESPPPRPLAPTEELNAASWSHYGPLIVSLVAAFLLMSIAGSVLAWLGIFAFVVPLVIRQVQGERSRFVKANATESLNFQLTWLMIGLAASALSVIPAILTFGLAYLLFIPIWIGFWIFMIVVMIKAGSAAKRGILYRYPLTFRFIQI